jgi:hypothetical protein
VAVGANADDGEVCQVDGEAALAREGLDERTSLACLDLPRTAALAAMEMAMLRLRQNMELLAAIRAVTVLDEAKLLEHVKSPVDGGGDRLWVRRATAFNEFRRRDVAVRPGQDA